MSYITGEVIRSLREKRNITQKELGNILNVSDKTISKWETGKGLPDVGMLSELAISLGVSVAELLTGELAENRNTSANMKKTTFYVCPVCGNVIMAVGEGVYSCCGITLPALTLEDNDSNHNINMEVIDNEYYVYCNHSMTKEHYISFLAYVTSNSIQLIKMYPEQASEARFARRGHGMIYGYCNRHGLFGMRI